MTEYHVRQFDGGSTFCDGRNSGPARLADASLARTRGRSFDVPPGPVAANARNDPSRHPVVAGDDIQSLPVLPTSPDGDDVSRADLRGWVGLTPDSLRMLVSPMGIPTDPAVRVESHAVVIASRRATAYPHVVHVVGVGAELQMVGPDARTNVATMTHEQPIGNGSVGELPRHPVRRAGTTVHLDRCVASPGLGSLEQPAPFGSYDLGPETVRPWKLAVPNTSVTVSGSHVQIIGAMAHV